MFQRLIRYRTRPGQADANARLVEAVYAELYGTRRARRRELRYVPPQ